MNYIIPDLPLEIDVETKAVLRQLSLSHRKLAELKGVALTIPNENILINTLILQEAKDSSAVENIVTTHDDLYKAELNMKNYDVSAATKEVQNYAEALKYGFQLIRKNKVLTLNSIKSIQQRLEKNTAGFRSVPGTTLQNQIGDVVYTPPQDKALIEKLMNNLQQFINDETMSSLDPLIKMSIIHHQFESIHPFYDGNGRTGRIINVLYLVINDLLDLPILYLSRYIITNKAEYYRLIQAVRDEGKWEEWILFILKGVEETAGQTITLVKEISKLMLDYKFKVRDILKKAYSHELLNNLFSHPYTKIEYVMEDTGVIRLTATKYLNKLVAAGLLYKVKHGKYNYYLNIPLIELLSNNNAVLQKQTEQIESVNR
ncbi:MAG: Fic family protein [Salinivirgaceae bacterium]|nr:Fic family protein [Salinivirgaceae bacterium]